MPNPLQRHQGFQKRVSSFLPLRAKNLAVGGMTLMELLVVLAIIAILAVLLLTVLPRVMDQVKFAKAPGNLKSLFQALYIYSVENNGRMPPSANFHTTPQFLEVMGGTPGWNPNLHLQTRGKAGHCPFAPSAAPTHRNIWYVASVNIMQTGEEEIRLLAIPDRHQKIAFIPGNRGSAETENPAGPGGRLFRGGVVPGANAGGNGVINWSRYGERYDNHVHAGFLDGSVRLISPEDLGIGEDDLTTVWVRHFEGRRSVHARTP